MIINITALPTENYSLTYFCLIKNEHCLHQVLQFQSEYILSSMPCINFNSFHIKLTLVTFPPPHHQ